MNLVYALTASVLVSLLSLLGIVGFIIRNDILKKILIFLVAFAAGGLIGGAFLHILPEAMEVSKDPAELFLLVIIGFVFFFLFEKYLYWRHCHDGQCDVHVVNYLNFFGDLLHNFTDGLIIGTTFLVDVRLGITATLAIVFHEIPNELGNYVIYIYGGFSKLKALVFNVVSSVTAILGTLMGYHFAHTVTGFSTLLLPFAAGGFIYIASCDLIPELHKETRTRRSIVTMVSFILGIVLMYVLKEF